jgi:hypothetical protein
MFGLEQKPAVKGPTMAEVEAATQRMADAERRRRDEEAEKLRERLSRADAPAPRPFASINWNG